MTSSSMAKKVLPTLIAKEPKKVEFTLCVEGYLNPILELFEVRAAF